MSESRFRFRRADRAPSGISLVREDNEQREQLARSVRRMRVSRSLLGLAWTAGPVTAIGLYGGYYIGFGQGPSRELLTYFISFTILSGLIALAAKIFWDSTWGYASEKAKLDVDEVIDKMGDLMLSVRNLSLESLDGDVRRRESAVHLLQRVDLAPGGVQFACSELTGDEEAGRLLAEIDNFRRAGLASRIEDYHAEHSHYFDQLIAELHKVSPQAAQMLQLRYQGDIAHLRHGIPRSEHFVERVLAAIEQDNLLLITMSDVESMLSLAFELINGREIPMLIFHYKGTWRLAAELDRMERKRSRYRIAQAASSNRVRALASWLVEIGAMDYEQVPDGTSVAVLVERVNNALDTLVQELDSLRIRYREEGDEELRGPLRELAETIATALRLYNLTHETYQRIGRAHVEFLSASESWNRMVSESRRGRRPLRFGADGHGVRILEKVVHLEEEERKEVCRHLARYMREQGLEAHESKGNFVHRKQEERPLTFDSARQLAVEVALALEPHVHLSYPEIQRGIGATHASYLGDLEPGMSAQEKRLMAEAAVRDVEEDMSRAAEQLALALVRHYRVTLTETACRFLYDTYGARESVLDILRQHQSHEEPPSMSLLSTRPVVVPRPRLRWYRSLVHARRLVGDDRFTPAWLERLQTPPDQ